MERLRPAAGESIPIMSNAGNHVPEGMDPDPFNSDPITSGPHYAEEYDPGFYDENQARKFVQANRNRAPEPNAP